MRDVGFGTILSGIILIVAVLAIPIGGSLLAYHWVDRPDHYVDGRWFTLGCIVFWTLVTGQGHASRD